MDILQSFSNPSFFGHYSSHRGLNATVLFIPLACYIVIAGYSFLRLASSHIAKQLRFSAPGGPF
jgi:fucose permease